MNKDTKLKGHLKKSDLILQGNSRRGSFIKCYCCGQKHVWLKAFEIKNSDTYKPVCYNCRKKKIEGE
jgi:hypothetical protein